ncbi:hypothetical protein TNCV_732981 [Trichonephila clavipes]|nr:hypothetical protein TNCV_732981 [Trichonephila clavipes]
MFAKVLVTSEKASGHERKVRFLIDSSCEISYISERVTSILRATPLREETTAVIIAPDEGCVETSWTSAGGTDADMAIGNAET